MNYVSYQLVSFTVQTIVPEFWVALTVCLSTFQTNCFCQVQMLTGSMYSYYVF